MSMYIVGKDHIDLLITAALAWECAIPERADEIGRMLWNENLNSAKYRYPDCRDGNWPAHVDFKAGDVDTYNFEAIEGPVDPQVVDTACRGYSYQLEHPGWDKSRAQAWVSILRAVAQHKLPEWEQRHGAITPDAVRRLYRSGSEYSRDWIVICPLDEPERVSGQVGWSVERDALVRVAATRAQLKGVAA